MKRIQASVSVPTVLVAFGLIAAAAGCKDSNSITGNNPSSPTPHASPPTPTPTPTTGLAGSWTGTWEDSVGGDCNPVPAKASFSVNGSSATGTLEARYFKPCGMGNVQFQGSLSGNELHGTMTGALFPDTVVTAHGSLSGTTLDMTYDFYNASGLPPFPGRLHLRR